MSGTRVFIGRLTYKARESDVERFFKGFGRIRDISLKNGYGFVEFEDPRDADDSVYELNNREILGERVTVEHARGVPRSGGGGGGGGGGTRSYRENHGGGGGGGGRHESRYESRGGGGDRGGSRNHSSRDERGRVNYYESRAISKFGPPVRTKYRVIVENLSTCVSWQDLKDYLRAAGKFEVTYADAHKHRQNQGVVDFATYDDMKRAMEKINKKRPQINGRQIRLIEDTSFRSASRSRSRSRSPRSRSRSGSRSGARYRSRSARRSKSRSPSGRRSASRSRSRSRSARRSASRSRSPRNSRSRSQSPRRSKSRGRSEENVRRSRSGSKSPAARANSASRDDRSPSLALKKHESDRDDEKMDDGEKNDNAVSRSRSRSASKE